LEVIEVIKELIMKLVDFLSLLEKESGKN